ncbi:MAG: phytoene desaturase family protein [Halorhabdus sp.]
MTTPRDADVTVVGGGFGGLSAACHLADAGIDVTIVEKNEAVGGRASRLERDGFVFDMGPSWYLMPEVFERFFAHFGHEPAEYYELQRLDPHYKIYFKDGDEIDISADRTENRELFESYEEGAGEAFDEYLATSQRHYETAMENFVYEYRPSWTDWLDPSLLKTGTLGLKLLGSMQGHVDDYFDNPKLQQIVQYTLVFLGGSPKNTPAIYNMMSHADFNLGVYYPQPVDGGPGGIGAVVDAIVDLAEELGVTIETGTEVTEITRRRDGFQVETAGGDSRRPDVVVANADYAHAEQDLMPAHERQYDADYWDDRTYAPSAFLLYLGVEGDLPELAHHTLVLPTDWSEHFDAIFEDPAWPEEPSYYLCVPSKTDDEVAPEGHSNLFALVPIATGLDDAQETRDRYREKILEDIAEQTGVDLEDRIVVEEQFSISEFADRYNATKGTAMGLAHTLRQTAMFRPPIESSAVEDLYFTGGYTTPGVGVPMCLISGEHAAEAVLSNGR